MTPDNEAFVRLAFGAQQPMAWIGASLAVIEDGSVTIAFAPHDALTTMGTGVVMGGIVATVCDVAAGLSILTRLDPPRQITTVDVTSHQIAPARGEAIICIGRVEKLGKAIAIASAEAFVETGGQRRLAARLTSTFAVS
jgi:acyl-coenzyme A thioesterase PaaI-like protein